MRRQFVLDAESDRMLNQLAASRAGNKSFVVREAIALYAGMEDHLDEIEAQAGFRRLMRRTAADIEAGRVMTQAEVERHLQKRR